ncbi:MAG: hypothetical protein ACRYFU_03395 [Janthinobacterium lividum]
MFRSSKRWLTASLVTVSLAATPLLLNVPAQAQYGHRHGDFSRGAYEGGRGGGYGRGARYGRGGYDDRYHGHGIGAGKGALIGGAGGAAVGAIFGGGLKGAIIGGSAGAGIGAIAGHEHQQNMKRDYYHGYGR